MKKRILAILLCCVLFLLCGCKTESVAEQKKYKRISSESEHLGEELFHITSDTSVIYNVVETVQTQMPIYEIRRHAISPQEFQQMEKQLGITEWYFNDYDGYEVYCRTAPYSDPNRGYFDTLNMTEDKLEQLAWETFGKIPFLEGEYEYAGQTGHMAEWSMESNEYITTEVTVSFYRSIDGICVVGNEQCDLTFDASGLVELYIVMYDYERIGTMDMVPLKEAKAKIKEPDSFSMTVADKSVVNELHVDRVKTYLINQFSEGCTILQPIYTFYGTAALDNGNQADFKSRIIAIPEEMTYEE